jgi:hypothetical protein
LFLVQVDLFDFGDADGPPGRAERRNRRRQDERAVVAARWTTTPVTIGPMIPDRLPIAFCTPTQVPVARGPANIWATA